MDLIEMYPAAVNSKVTVTLGVLNADSTIIEVLDGSVLPDAPNLLVLGSDQTAETVKLTAKEGNTLTVERGIQGNAIAWPAGTQIARNFTAKDWNDLVANVATIVAKILGLTAADVHARPDTWMPTAFDVGAVALIDANSSDHDMDNVIKNKSLSGLMYKTGSQTLGTPYAKGVTGLAEAIILNISSSVNYGAQFAFLSGGQSSNLMLWRTLRGGTISDWSIGFIPQDGSVAMTGELKYYDGSKTLAYPVPMSNTGFHNSVYRGKYLGTSVTDAQWTAIRNGTFEDLYIGDYWTIGGINYRIAAFDYYYRTGDTSCDTHHVVLVPDVIMYTHVMNDTNITDGAYVGSKMYTEGLAQAKTTITNAFGSAHILNHRQLLCNATANGYETGHAWYDSTVELMTEQNVYGCKIFGNQTNGTGWAYNYTIDKSQYPLFTFRPDMISNRQWFWLRDVANAAYFANVGSNGSAYAGYASYASGVRPAFSIC